MLSFFALVFAPQALDVIVPYVLQSGLTGLHALALAVHAKLEHKMLVPFIKSRDIDGAWRLFSSTLAAMDAAAAAEVVQTARSYNLTAPVLDVAREQLAAAMASTQGHHAALRVVLQAFSGALLLGCGCKTFPDAGGFVVQFSCP